MARDAAVCTDSVNIPKMLTGTTVAIQTADNTPVSQTDLSDTFINCPVRTIAGQQSVALQLIDQSPIAFDDVVFRDLTAAHAAVLDQQVMYGTGSSGQVLGVTQTPGVTGIAVASLDISGIYKAIANAIQTIHVTRFLPPEVIVMHPRRWGWLLTLLDTQNRPLFVPDANSAFNAAGILEDVDSQQVVGRSHGLPIVTDQISPQTSAPAQTKIKFSSGASAIWCYSREASARGYFPNPNQPTSQSCCRCTPILRLRLPATRPQS